MLTLTDRQQLILDYITHYWQRCHKSPTYRDIQTHFQLKSLASVHKHICSLKRKGALSAQPYQPRSLCPALSSQAIKPLSSQLPYKGFISAGKPLELFASAQSVVIPPHMMPQNLDAYLLKVQGDGFQEEEYILDGDLLIIEKQSHFLEGQLVLLTANQNQALIKRPFSQGSILTLQPTNSHYQPLVLRSEKVQIEGIINAVLRLF